ncbi:MAG: isoprenyl transferase [Lachnospiraceae bacterium]|nr:isoprenyl transferase [Lachnospiraceae bacterium]
MAKKSEEVDLSELKIPQHVAIIMDGNGRWAKKRMLPRNMGHRAGAKTMEDICEDAWDLGIKYLTLYAFSTENWKRSEEEVSGIMDLLRKYLVDCIERSAKNNMRVRIIGDRTALAPDIQEKIVNLEEASKGYTGLNLTIAINYGGRDELRRAVRGMVEEASRGELDADKVTEDFISSRLDTRELPDPDLLIRTSGEERLSNYLIWQLAYTEFYFTDCLWPDFDKKELIKAVRYFNGRDRRFGGV